MHPRSVDATLTTMRTVRVVALAAILACTVACAVGSSVVDLAPPNHGPALGWARHAKADPAHPVLVTVAVKQRCSAARVEAELMAVSSPDSPRCVVACVPQFAAIVCPSLC